MGYCYTTKTSFGDDFVKIRPAVAKRWRIKKNTERPLKYKKTLPSLAASGGV